MEINEAQLYIKKSSKRAAFLSFSGILIVAASFAFGFYHLSTLQNKSQELDQQIEAKKNEIQELNSRLNELQQKIKLTEIAFSTYNNAVLEKNPLLAKEALIKTVQENPQAIFANEELTRFDTVKPKNFIIGKNQSQQNASANYAKIEKEKKLIRAATIELEVRQKFLQMAERTLIQAKQQKAQSKQAMQ